MKTNLGRQMIYVLILNRIGTIITLMSIIHMGPANQIHDDFINFYCLLFIYNLVIFSHEI